MKTSFLLHNFIPKILLILQGRKRESNLAVKKRCRLTRAELDKLQLVSPQMIVTCLGASRWISYLHRKMCLQAKKDSMKKALKSSWVKCWSKTDMRSTLNLKIYHLLCPRLIQLVETIDPRSFWRLSFRWVKIFIGLIITILTQYFDDLFRAT